MRQWITTKPRATSYVADEDVLVAISKEYTGVGDRYTPVFVEYWYSYAVGIYKTYLIDGGKQ